MESPIITPQLRVLCNPSVSDARWASLITTPELRVLYKEAESYSKHKSWTIRFFSYFLQTVTFRNQAAEDTWFVSPDQLPTATPLERRPDLVVSHFRDGLRVRVICFIVATAADSQTDKQQLKDAAWQYCQGFGMLQVYVISTVGAKAMFLSYHLDGYRLGMILPEGGLVSVAEGKAYLDPDTPQGAAYWQRAIGLIKGQLPALVQEPEELFASP